MHRLDLSLYSHLKEFFFTGWGWGEGEGEEGGEGGMESESMLTLREKIPSSGRILLRGGLNPLRCIKQDSEPDTLPTSYSGPQVIHTDSLSVSVPMQTYQSLYCFTSLFNSCEFGGHHTGEIWGQNSSVGSVLGSLSCMM